ncbi:MAG: transaldolase [Candidatus Omnitrophica bacterium]|nr:transaldolase [Candidatus Omnitrophota bacterium]
MKKTTIQQLADYGQSAWLDYISRPLLESGKLKELIAQGLRGMTSNPSIFNQAISSGNDYDAKIVQLKGKGKSTFDIYDALTIADIQDAADQFQQVYAATKGLDGYVSLEVNPKIAHKTAEQITEGLRLFKAVGRPNLMIKVPATPEGFKVVEELTANGVNVNTTLIFSLKQYERTAEAYFAGLTRLLKKKGSVPTVHSVASVFVSRVDTLIDDLLEKHADAKSLQPLKGKAAVANCRIIFERYHQFVNSSVYKALAAQGANMQRVLWGSTSTKNPQYSDIKYVTELIARPTVNTIPEKTLLAFLDHGKVQEAFGAASGDAARILSQLRSLGIDIDSVCQGLLRDGVKAFEDAFEALLNAIEKKATALVNR